MHTLTMKKASLLYLIILWSSMLHYAMAQDNFQLRRFSVNDGISQGIVQAILQDHNGYIWFSTWNGLNKYNGYNFRSFKSKPGEGAALSSNRIVELEETASGDIWCRTQERQAYLFDIQTEQFVDVMGEAFPEETGKIRINKIVALDNGAVWLIAADHSTCFRIDEKKNNAVTRYDDTVKGWHAGRVTQVTLDHEGNEWILTDRGPNIIGHKKVGSDFAFKFLCVKRGTVWLVSNNGQMAASDAKGLRFMGLMPEVRKVNQMKAISDTLLTVGTDRGLFLVHIPSGRMEHVPVASASHPSQEVKSVFKDSKRRLWMFTMGEGIVRYDLHTKTLVHLPSPVRNDEFNKHPFVYEDAMGVIRVNPQFGFLSWYDEKEGRLKPYMQPDGSLFSPQIRVYRIDRQKNLWYGAARNLYHVAFFQSNADYLSGSLGSEVRSLLADNRQQIWVGTKDAMVRIYRKGDRHPLYLDRTGRLTPSPSPFFGNVYSMMQDREGQIWMGTRGDGIVLATPQGSGYSLKRFVHSAGDAYSLSSDDVYAFFQDSRGRIWIGTYLGGPNLAEPVPGGFRFVHGGNRLKNYPFPYQKSKIRAMGETRSGVILVAASEGLLTFSSRFARPEEIKFHLHTADYRQPDGLACTEIMNLCITRDDSVFLATSTGGFNKLLPGNLLSDSLRVRTYDATSGLLSDQALSVVEDKKGYLWFVTENYLIRYNRRKESFEHFGRAFFHRELYFSEGNPLCLNDSSLLFPTLENGVLGINPLKIHEAPYMPPIVFTGLRMHDRPGIVSLDNRDEIVLQPDERNITIEFAALDYVLSASIQYAYRLKGLDKEWNYCGSSRAANYNNLPPGHYVFQVRSTNRDGVWTDEIKQLAVVIRPTFWETPWAWCVYVPGLAVIILSLAYLLSYIYRLRHKVDVEQQLAEVKLRFFTDISHELRTPLTLIASPVTEVLQHEAGLSDTGRTHLQLAQKNVDRMLKLVNQLLDFRKIQNRKMKLIVEQTDAVLFSRQICASFDLLAEERGIDYRFESDVPSLRMWLDRDKFEKICYNLLSNAFKYTPDGGHITFFLHDYGNRAVFAVRDTGRGIPPARLSKLFQRFETLPGYGWAQPSSGIGLSLAKDFVELHHGTIDVKSAEAQGSEFSFSLPKEKAAYDGDPSVEFLLEDHTDNVPASSSPEEEAAPSQYPVTILVVEDNEELRLFLRSILSENYRTLLAVNGEEGLELARSENPDLIVSDVMMPVMDGIRMVQLIKESPAVCHIPIILLTAKSSLDDRIAGLHLGVDDYVTKPFSVSYLKAKIHNLLQKRQAWQEEYRKSLAQQPTEQQQPTFAPTEVRMTPYDQLFMKKLMDIIERNMNNDALKVEQMAEAMDMTRAVFYAKLKSITGLPPLDFLKDMRIKRACQLLVTGHYSVSDVSYMTGFNDPKYFARIFRKKMGCSPTEFKEREKQEGENA